jgi:hypothetical protein
MANIGAYRKLNPSGAEPREISTVVNGLIEGKSNNTGDFVTTTLSTSSTLYDERIGFQSVILFMPINHDSAAELVDIYFDTFAKGSCVVHYGNHAAVRTYRYIIVG